MERRRLRVTGTVQGVGFRPFVYRQATALELAGQVANDHAGVVVDVQGTVDRLNTFHELLVAEPPPLARIDSVTSETLPPYGAREGFQIVSSVTAGAPSVPVSVDVATCADCLAELADPGDRRYRYPFINCTNCGPRYTIVQSVPYDRPLTTMAGFVMCPSCQKEYDDPADRRFHAQPNACPACGPTLTLARGDGRLLAGGDAALTDAITMLRAGAILAIKGLGGFHLAVDATNPAAVTRLRRRKARDDKPFGIMVNSLQQARELCMLDEAARAALASPSRPIVIAPRQAAAAIADAVAPGIPQLGIFLPYTPLHHLLLDGVARPLVMTSGNLTDEPITHLDTDAFGRLRPLTDAVLTHNREIHIRCDDSVTRALGDGRLQVTRRSRGYAPQPLPLPIPADRPLLAVGAHLKNTIAVAKEGFVVASHHIGDLDHLATHTSFQQAIDHLCKLYGVRPEVVACDLHPQYRSTLFAEDFAADSGLPVEGVQHHHAHVASCLVEHGRSEPVVALAYDGTGFGTDGTLWGGEVLVADLVDARRAGHLRVVPLPGGESAIRQPWRMAVAWLDAALGLQAAQRYAIREPTGEAVLAVARSGRSPMTSSVGRLFDAAAALLFMRCVVNYEGQAAIELEACAGSVGAIDVDDDVGYPVDVRDDGGTLLLDPAPMLAAMVHDRDRGAEVAAIAARFHAGLAAASARAAAQVAETYGLDTVVLTGGVFQNALFSRLTRQGLSDAGLTVLEHAEVPPGDGGICIGQTAVAAARLAKAPD